MKVSKQTVLTCSGIGNALKYKDCNKIDITSAGTSWFNEAECFDEAECLLIFNKLIFLTAVIVLCPRQCLYSCLQVKAEMWSLALIIIACHVNDSWNSVLLLYTNHHAIRQLIWFNYLFIFVTYILTLLYNTLLAILNYIITILRCKSNWWHINLYIKPAQFDFISMKLGNNILLPLLVNILLHNLDFFHFTQ